LTRPRAFIGALLGLVFLMLALAAPGPAGAALDGTTTVQGTLVQLIRTSQYGRPAPDPAGIAYSAATGRFIISDSEVDEMSIYQGRNLFTATRTGSGTGTGTTVAFSKEPSDVGLNPANNTLFVSDDDRDKIFIDRPGADGKHGTADDRVRSFSTAAFGSTDSEGVEYDPASGHLFVADGRGAEVYRVDPVNGVFGDGNDVVTHFDMAVYGSRDAEGIGIDRRRNLLLVSDPSTMSIYELTKSGNLVRIIDCHGIPTTNRLYADVTMAPTSNPNDSPSALNYWIVDRQVDNGTDPNENDGKLYEVSAPDAPDAIRIRRIYFDSPGADTGSNASLNAEWIRLRNRGSKGRWLTGWTIRDASGHTYRFGTFKLQAGKTVTVHTGSGSNSSGHRYWRLNNHVWNNTGDTARLRNSAGTLIDKCSYSGAGSSVGC
jgi:Lamin Tail Domain